MGWILSGGEQISPWTSSKSIIIAFFFNCLLTMESRNKCHGFKGRNGPEKHIELLRLLSNKVPILPPVDDMLALSRKMDVIKVFDLIAEQVTCTARPTTNVVELPLKEIPKDIVFKREGSDMAEHVYLPHEVARLTPNTLTRRLKKKSAGYRWITQTYIPQLRQFGEWRVYVVGGEVFQVITTQPRCGATTAENVMNVDVLHGMWNLAELT